MNENSIDTIKEIAVKVCDNWLTRQELIGEIMYMEMNKNLYAVKILGYGTYDYHPDTYCVCSINHAKKIDFIKREQIFTKEQYDEWKLNKMKAKSFYYEELLNKLIDNNNKLLTFYKKELLERESKEIMYIMQELSEKDVQTSLKACILSLEQLEMELKNNLCLLNARECK